MVRYVSVYLRGPDTKSLSRQSDPLNLFLKVSQSYPLKTAAIRSLGKKSQSDQSQKINQIAIQNAR